LDGVHACPSTSGSRTALSKKEDDAAGPPFGIPGISPVFEGNNHVIHEPPHVPRPRRGRRRRPAVAALAGTAFADKVSADTLPNYAPVPPASLGHALNADGYYVGQVEKNLYYVTDGNYIAAFLATCEGVVLFDAPATIGHNLQRAINTVADGNDVSNKVTHIVYSHHHADHLGASSLFGDDVLRIGQAQTKTILASENDPTRPLPDVTFKNGYTLKVGGSRVDLAWLGTNHTPDNTYIHFPDHDALMLVDIILPAGRRTTAST
jgi:glyoxylase-like metal-dependent hydrolase (beta-lactamase superfamily II)